MDHQELLERNRIRRTTYLAFGLSGICSISSGVVVSILQDLHGYSYQMTGSLLTGMNLGNMAAAFLAGLLPGKIGIKKTLLLMGTGYALGYLMTGFVSAPVFMMLAFLMIGLAKGAALNGSSVLVGTHTGDRKASMQIMHSFYATGALLGPFLLTGLGTLGNRAPMLGLAGAGLLMWLIFLTLPGKNLRSGTGTGKKRASDLSFLKTPSFWLLTALMFCQNGAEYGVNGWMVTYYKNQGILSGSLAAYAMTIMWGATLIGRLAIAFLIPIRNHFRALAVMGGCCSVLYAGLILIQAQVPAVAVLILFSLAMAGMNPMITASTGASLSSESLAVLLPLGSLGGLLMPLMIGVVSERMGIRAGMSVDLIPCASILILSLIAMRVTREKTGRTEKKS